MSASPAQQAPSTGAPTPTTTNSAPTAVRKKPAVNIFAKKKPVKKAQPSQLPKALAQASKAPASVQTTKQPPSASNGAVPPAPVVEEEGHFEEYPIIVTKSSNSQGLRYHAMKLQSRTDDKGQIIPVNPYDDKTFVRPLKLHRRFARDQLQTAELPEQSNGLDDKEREAMLSRKLERQAERESNQKLIAPTGGEVVKPVKKKPQKKVEEGRDETNQNRIRRQQLRYEEARPWHLEDFESKNVWVGSYEAPLSGQSVMFIVDNAGFRLVPVEKWYKFIQTNRVSTMDSEDVEKHMNKKFNYPRWALGTQLANDELRKEQTMRVKQERMSRKREEAEEQAEMKPAGDEYQADVDQIDFDFGDDNMFQDDDEGKLIEAAEGEDSKEIERRIHEEMRNAGLGGTGVKDEQLDDFEEYRQQQFAEMDEKKKSRRLRKQLLKKERKVEYESDSEGNLYGDSSEDDEDSDDEKEKQEAEKKKEEAKKAALALGEKSGTSSRGNNTPNGRIEKRDPTRLGATLGKRAGSPDASDMSGNESSRKKVKSLHGRAVTANAANGARSEHKLARSALAGGSGSGSDTDSSRPGRPKIRLKPSQPGSPAAASPIGSRAASPTAAAAGGSRAQSPKPAAAAAPNLGFPTLEEVRAAIPPEGIEIKKLAVLFRGQVAGRSADFVPLVRAAGQQDRITGKIMPKSTAPPA